MENILIAGCGYVGTALGQLLTTAGHRVWGIRRSAAGLPSMIRHLAADLTNPETLQDLPSNLDVVVYTAAADGPEEAAYRAAYVDGVRHLLEALVHQRQSPRRVLFTSSTAVYPQSNGAWVDETTPTEPRHFTGKTLLEGERLLANGPFPATILRLAGIYGPERTSLIARVRAGLATYRQGAPLYTNRIHRDDCAGALHHLMTLPEPELVYLGVDHQPAAQCEVLRWLAQQLGAPEPRMDTAADTNSRRHRTNKRCSNARLLASGYVFQYPTYRQGYTAVLAAEQPRPGISQRPDEVNC